MSSLSQSPAVRRFNSTVNLAPLATVLNLNHQPERIIMMKSKIPQNAKRIPLRPVALGEVTGHHHSFMANVEVDVADLVEMYEENGTTYVRVLGEPGDVSLVHQEHKAHVVNPGEYSVTIQQENTDWGSRPVAD
jgi:hypothetical protein